MEKAKNIAIFGGAFNPIHKGHINLINEFDKIFRFDKILLVPTKIQILLQPTKDTI